MTRPTDPSWPVLSWPVLTCPNLSLSVQFWAVLNKAKCHLFVCEFLVLWAAYAAKKIIIIWYHDYLNIWILWHWRWVLQSVSLQAVVWYWWTAIFTILPFFSSTSQPFLIKRLLGSKNLFHESWWNLPKPTVIPLSWLRQPFWGHLVAILDFAGVLALQVWVSFDFSCLISFQTWNTILPGCGHKGAFNYYVSRLEGGGV